VHILNSTFFQQITCRFLFVLANQHILYTDSTSFKPLD